MCVLQNVITFGTGSNQYAIVMCCNAVMAVSKNGFFLFEKVSFLVAMKFTCYAELAGGVHARKTGNADLCNTQHAGLVVFM
jgi:hypothetical protein